MDDRLGTDPSEEELGAELAEDLDGDLDTDLAPNVEDRDLATNDPDRDLDVDCDDVNVDKGLDDIFGEDSEPEPTELGLPEKSKTFLLKVPDIYTLIRDPLNHERISEELERSLDSEGYENGDFSRAILATRCSIDAAQIVRTNTHLVEWSDGSFTLAIGDVQLEILSQTSLNRDYLYARKGDGGTMQACAKISQKLIVKPTLDSLAYKGINAPSSYPEASTVKVKLAVTTVDPEKEKSRMVKLEQERTKAKRRQESRKRTLDSNFSSNNPRSTLVSQYLEDESSADSDFYAQDSDNQNSSDHSVGTKDDGTESDNDFDKVKRFSKKSFISDD